MEYNIFLQRVVRRKMSERIAYHPGFYSAAELEFREDADRLEFAKEYNLSKEPLRMDMLIILKNDDAPLKNDVGKIFRRHNIIEYKSPKESLNIDNYYKALAYASLYKSSGKKVNEIDANEVTVSLFKDSYPRKLISNLKQNGAVIEQTFKGIYYVTGNILFPTQIVVMSQLEDENHAAFRILSDHATERDVRAFLEGIDMNATQGEMENTKSVLTVSAMANAPLYKLLRSEDNMKSIIDEMIEESLERREEQTKRESVAMLIKNGKLSLGDIAECIGLPIDTVKEISASMAK